MQSLKELCSYLMLFCLWINTSQLVGQVSLEAISGMTLEAEGGIQIELDGNWLNQGNLIANTNQITLNGADLQQISNENGAFDKLIIDKSNGLTQASSNFTVDGILTLISGDLDFNGQVITLGANALLSETEGQTVQGLTGQIQTTRSLNPPAGNIGGMGFEINGSTDMGNTQLIRRHAALIGNGNESILRSFEIIPDQNGGLNASIVFHYDPSELNGQIAADLQLYHSTDDGTTWTLAGGIVNPSTHEISLDHVDGVGGWWTASDQSLEDPPICAITAVSILTTSDCDPLTNTYTQALEVVYNEALNGGSIVVNGESFAVTSSPQTVVLTDLVADGQTVDVNVCWSEFVDCKLEIANAFTAPDDCSVPCNIISAIAGNPYNCDPNSDTYSRDVKVTYEGTNLSGSIMVKLDNDAPIAFPIGQSPQVLTLVDLPSDGKWVDIEIYFSEDNGCSWIDDKFFKNPQNCNANPGGECDITDLVASEQRCTGDTYEQDIIVSYEDAPATGTLQVLLNGSGNWYTFPITASPQVLTLTGLNPDGQDVDVFVKFSDDAGCTKGEDNLFIAPSGCTPVEPCAIIGLVAGSQSSCNSATNTYTQEIMVMYEHAPASGELVVNGQSFAMTGSPQTVTLTNLPANGLSIDVTAYFSADSDCEFTEVELFTAPEACSEPPTGEGEVLFVVKSGDLNAGDQAVKDRMELLGYTVIVMSHGDAKTEDATGKVLVLISNSVSANAVKTKFTEVATPVMLWEAMLYDEMGMTANRNGTDYGQDNNEFTIDIDDDTHIMASGLSGEVAIFHSSSSVTWGKPNDNAVKVASTQGSYPHQWALFGYDVGAEMVSLIAPARRVGIFLKDSEVPSLNENGWALFDAAVCWAAGCEGEAEERFSPTSHEITAFPNPFLDELNLEWEYRGQEVEISLTNMLGIQIYRQKQRFDGRLKLHLSNIPEGIYILRIIGENNFKQEMKVMKE